MSDSDKTIVAGVGGRVLPGLRLNGIYQIDQLVGAGGMSEIYRGHNVQTFEKVAIKVILPQYARDEQIVSLFRREALILNRLSHEAIIRYHVFSHDPVIDLLYLAMEYVEGPTLRERMQQRSLSQLEACQLIAKVAAGMRVAHDEGVVHRDLSSDNIILANGDVSRPKVIDFGIARAGDANDSTLIESGFAGKYNYVSPEQLGLFGGQVGPAADVYSLGLVFAAALRGRPLDMSGTHADVVMKRQGVPDLSQLNPSVKPLIERMLQPNPLQRIKSMADVMLGIDEIIGPRLHTQRADQPMPLAGSRALPAPQPKKARRGPFVALLLLGCTVAVAWGLDRYGIFDLQREMAKLRETTSRVAANTPADPGGKSQDRAPAPPGLPPDAGVPVSPGEPETGQAGAAAQLDPEIPIDGGEPASPPPPRAAAAADVEPRSADEQPPPRISLNDGPSDGSAQPSNRSSIARWVRQFDGGECFYVRPLGVTPESATIEGFSRTVEPLERLDNGFRSAFGFEPTIRMRPTEAGQCAALGLVAVAPGSLRIELKSDLVGNDQPLTARVSNLSTSHVALFIVSPGGALTNVTDSARPDRKNVVATVPATGIKTDDRGYLMLAVGADKALRILDTQRADTAAGFVADLQRQAEAEGARLEAGVVYFRRK